MNAAIEVGLWALRRRRRFRVSGRSMLPGLSPGSFILIDPRRIPEVGDVVVAGHPSKGIEIVKRVRSITDAVDGVGPVLDLASDNAAEGADSSTFGLVPLSSVRGVMTLTLG